MLTSFLLKQSFTSLLLVALIVQSVTCAETASQTSKDKDTNNGASSILKSNSNSDFTNNEKTSSQETSHELPHNPSNPALNSISQTNTIQNTPKTSSETPEINDIVMNNGANPIWGPYSAAEQTNFLPADEDMRYQQEMNDLDIQTDRDPEYILFHLPNEEKRFMRGFRRDGDGLELAEDKRFMRGFNFKRDSVLDEGIDGEFPDEQFEEKRFLRGFNKYAKKDDKRFMRGLRRDNTFDDLMDKRFMRGFRNSELDNIDDKRFIVGLNRFAAQKDKRFMRGFSNYNKRFMHGLQNYGKRFMRGLVKRDDSDASGFGKRFIVGLNGYGRRANSLAVNTDSGTRSEDMDKRFMKGFHSYANMGKRFIKGFGKYAKKYIPEVDDEHVHDGGDVSNDKRFMRGLTKKENADGSNNGEYDKRFIKGLVKKSDGTDDEIDKRFIKGLVKKSDDTEEEIDKKFIKGLVKKSDGTEQEIDKKFIKGLVKKSDDAEQDLDKRFIKGLVKKSDDTQEETDKRFIKGLVKKSDGTEDDLDKRFIKGLVKKSDDIDEEADKRFIKGLSKKTDNTQETLDKRFIKGLVRKSEDDKRFMRGLHKKFDASPDKRFIKGLGPRDRSFASQKKSEDEKRFMRGFGKKSVEEEELESMSDKRFMRGLYAKKDNEFTDDDSAVSGMPTADGDSKRFIKGLKNYVKKEDSATNEDSSEIADDKRFMRGLVKKENAEDNINDDKRFMRGLVKKENAEDNINDDKRFMRGLVKKEEDGLDKRFMRGLVKRDIGQSREKRETRFDDDVDEDILRKLEGEKDDDDDVSAETDATGTWYDFPAYDLYPVDKRFMRGLGHYTKRNDDDELSDFDDIEPGDDFSDISKRFLRGYINYYSNKGSESQPKRFLHPLIKQGQFESVSGVDKRFIKGLDMYPRPALGKRFMRGMQYLGRRADDGSFLQDKRFMRGLHQFTGGVDKRFIRGLAKYVKRPTDSATSWGNTYSNDKFQKRFSPGPHYPSRDSQQFIGPSFRHSQVSSLYTDEHNPLQMKTDSVSVPSPFSGGSSGTDSRRFLEWRKGGFV